MPEVVQVLFIASLSFVSLFIIAKIMGKKQISELSFVDYVVGISLGSIAAQMAIDSDTPFYHFLIAMAIYLILDYIISFLCLKSFTLKKIFRGSPAIFINNGRLEYENLKKNKIDINEFLAMCREKEYFDINDIAYCIYETDGQISILPKSHAAPLVSGDMNISKPRPVLSVDFVVDGKIMEQALIQTGKTKDWLLKKLGDKNAEVENIALANYIKQTDDVIIYFKK